LAELRVRGKVPHVYMARQYRSRKGKNLGPYLQSPTLWFLGDESYTIL
jgi:hypothetical protein